MSVPLGKGMFSSKISLPNIRKFFLASLQVMWYNFPKDMCGVLSELDNMSNVYDPLQGV